ncbi:DUF3667 domain-containing protein [Maribellus sediminis]|uniref:DUF3667 domain-containing protein n=1 Tax=Maribellus sediminis TaxID=2696285 RepID=UPI0014305C27|nr:DUF3667 domain-containing protein [Maribellus sediminis]
MPQTCKNCDNEFDGQFCNNCGQNASLHKINLKYLWFDLTQGLLNFDTGFFYTVKQLLSRPGHTAREFIEGKRVAHFRPVSFLIVITTIEALLFHFTGFKNEVATFDPNSEFATQLEAMSEWMDQHQSIIILASLPFYAFWTRLFFRRQNYNYAELLILNIFVAAQRIVVGFLIFPVFYILNLEYNFYTDSTVIISFVLIAWIYAQFFKQVRRIKSITLALLTNFLSFISFYIFVVLIMFLGILVLK